MCRLIKGRLIKDIRTMSERSSELVSAVHLATQKLSSTQSVEETLREVLELCVEASGAYGGTIYIHDPSARKLVFRHVIPKEVADQIQMKRLDDTEGIAGEAFQTRKSIISRFDNEASDGPRAQVEQATSVKVRNMVTVPLMIPGMDPIGLVQLVNKKSGEFVESDLQVLETVCSVSAMAYLNSVLGEQASKAASLMGMGRVAHDIGNLSSALSYDLMYMEPMVKDLANAKTTHETMREYAANIASALDDLRESIETIISYSRLISNISAGQAISASKKPKKVSELVANAVSFLETQARTNHVALRYDIQPSQAASLIDPLFVIRIVQNLTGNAIRAVCEGVPTEWANKMESREGLEVLGEVTVKYRFDEKWHVITVTDTGPGMSEEIVQQIMSGTANSRWAASKGSGWGTKIVRELAGAHGGVIEVRSQLGAGTEFEVKIPLELEPAEAVKQ